MFVHEIIQRGRPEAVALFDHGRKVAFGELGVAVRRFRAHLYSEGIRVGDTVAIFSRNSVEFVCAYMAIVSLGAIAVPINFQLSNREIAFIIKDARAKLLLTYKELDLAEALAAIGHPGALIVRDLVSFAAMDGLPEAPPLPPSFDENNPCVIIYTSGTTGNPKGAVLSHRNLVCNAEQLSLLKRTADDKILCVLPMYHCFGWTCAVIYPLYCGAEVVILDAFSPKETIDTIRTEGVTGIVAVPSICSLITKLARPEDMATLNFVLIGGTTLPLKLAQDFTEKFGLAIVEGYGLSEASPVVTMNPVGRERVSSVGVALPGLRARLVDAEGNDVPVGEPGELLVRGDNVMLGYWHMPEATKEALRDGWLHTGDVAKVDGDGYYYIVDRLKDMIISMGENIYPREVEELIYKFPGINEAAVIGVPDKLRGQAGACFYSLNEGAELSIRELKKFLQKNLALYKIPREFHKLDSLPRTATGKISKKTIFKDFMEKKESRD